MYPSRCRLRRYSQSASDLVNEHEVAAGSTQPFHHRLSSIILLGLQHKWEDLQLWADSRLEQQWDSADRRSDYLGLDGSSFQLLCTVASDGCNLLLETRPVSSSLTDTFGRRLQRWIRNIIRRRANLVVLLALWPADTSVGSVHLVAASTAAASGQSYPWSHLLDTPWTGPVPVKHTFYQHSWLKQWSVNQAFSRFQGSSVQSSRQQTSQLSNWT